MKFKLVEQLNNNIFYRVTRGIDTDIFSCEHPEFFTKNLDYAKEYAEEPEHPVIYTVKLNINNPFDLSDKVQQNIFNQEYIPWAREHKEIFDNIYTDGNLSDEKINEILWPKFQGDLLDFVNADYIYDFLKENHPEYDGLIVDEQVGGKFKGTLSYVPFYSEQITILDKQVL